MMWRSSSYSAQSGNCVQVRQDHTAIRDSKAADGSTLSTPALQRFAQAVKADSFNR